MTFSLKRSDLFKKKIIEFWNHHFKLKSFEEVTTDILIEVSVEPEGDSEVFRFDCFDPSTQNQWAVKSRRFCIRYRVPSIDLPDRIGSSSLLLWDLSDLLHFERCFSMCSKSEWHLELYTVSDIWRYIVSDIYTRIYKLIYTHNIYKCTKIHLYIHSYICVSCGSFRIKKRSVPKLFAGDFNARRQKDESALTI